MKHLLLIAGAAALAAASPAAAKPDKQGKKHGNHAAQNHRGMTHDIGIGRCPPGLAKKNNGCLPPGQAKKLYNVGQRWSGDYGQRWTYSQIPDDWRNRYDLDPNDRYYYGDGYVYQVDPKTMLIQQVLSAILR